MAAPVDIVLPLAPSLFPPAPSVLPLKRLCSLSRTETAATNPKFGVYIICIYVSPASTELQAKGLLGRSFCHWITVCFFSSF